PPYVSHPDLHSFPTRRSSDLPGAIELLHRLSKTHKLAIASSTWPIKIQRWLEKSNLSGMFTAVVACGDQISCKPAPDCYLRALKDRKSTRLNSSHRTISYAVF